MSDVYNVQNNADKGWLEDNRNVRKIITILVIICLGLFVASFTRCDTDSGEIQIYIDRPGGATNQR